MVDPTLRAGLTRGVRAVRILLVLALLTAVGAGGAWLYIQQAFDAPAAPGSEQTVVFEVKKGATLAKVGLSLKAQQLINDAKIWRLYLRLNPTAPSPKAGKHKIGPGMSIPDILDALAQNPMSEDVPLTMVEGWRLKDADQALAAKGLIEAGAYLKAATNPGAFTVPFSLPKDSPTLEGYLFPETYMVPPGKLDVAVLIQRQIDAFSSRFVKPNAKEIADSPRSLAELVVLASMLEREEPKPSLRPKVAGVMGNRLEANTPLGIDATSRYTIDEWNDRRAFLKKLRDPKDPYNTRLKAGLPPTAIGAPSLPSLLAALRPEPSKYWYYLHDAKQNIHFAKTAAEHEANRKRYNVW